jgi:hypothetical protein
MSELVVDIFAAALSSASSLPAAIRRSTVPAPGGGAASTETWTWSDAPSAPSLAASWST